MISAADFVKAWQAGKSVPDVAKRLGCNVSTANQRAYQYRKAGVPLKPMPHSGRPPLDVKALAKLARETAPKEAK